MAFLSADWRNLIMINHPVEPALLKPLVPAGTELDFFEGRTWLSVVGFLFLDTRVLGLPIPFHVNFEEVNLRFYVRREVDGEVRRGVAFVKEIVPRRAIAWVARNLYNEPYVAHPMDHHLNLDDAGGNLCYRWRTGPRWNTVAAELTSGEPRPLEPGSEAEFIAEHYYGYAAQPDGGTKEYRVAHPPWRVWETSSSDFHCDVANVYGYEYREALSGEPSSAFVAEGSRVKVYRGRRLRS